MKLEIDNSNYKICKVTQHYKNGTEVIIEMVKLTPNTALKDEFFQWTEAGHEGVEVVDLTKAKKKKKGSYGKETAEDGIKLKKHRRDSASLDEDEEY